MALNFLEQRRFFSKISPKNLEVMSNRAKQHFYKKGTLILNYDQFSTTFLYLITGWVKIFKESSDGKEVIVDILNNVHCKENKRLRFVCRSTKARLPRGSVCAQKHFRERSINLLKSVTFLWMAV